MKNIVIGVLGGMGTYATIHMFKEYAEIFEAEKEWERPRIIIDNRCTMPSRVRAFLYQEKVDELIDEMTDSLVHLASSGCNKIILACNTSHLFLPKIYEKAPELQNKMVNIIDICVNKIKDEEIKEIFLLGSEGTIDSHIYQDALKKDNIKCLVPKKEEYQLIRDCIEAVKQNKYDALIEEKFLSLVNRSNYCLLGCTELPILYEKYKDKVTCEKLYDPLYLSLLTLKEE